MGWRHTGQMTDHNGNPIESSGDDELTPDEVELEAYDLDGDGKISIVEAERARLGLLDARLEEIAEEGGLKGSLAEAAHKVVDKLDNDG